MALVLVRSLSDSSISFAAILTSASLTPRGTGQRSVMARRKESTVSASTRSSPRPPLFTGCIMPQCYAVGAAASTGHLPSSIRYAGPTTTVP